MLFSRGMLTAIMLLTAFALRSEALMARLTCHCDVGDITGVCVSASYLPSPQTKAAQRNNTECNVLCAKRPEVLRRCENAAGMHVGEASCTSFSFNGCAMSCSDDCEHGCEVQRYERSCAGMRIGI